MPYYDFGTRSSQLFYPWLFQFGKSCRQAFASFFPTGRGFPPPRKQPLRRRVLRPGTTGGCTGGPGRLAVAAAPVGGRRSRCCPSFSGSIYRAQKIVANLQVFLKKRMYKGTPQRRILVVEPLLDSRLVYPPEDGVQQG